MKTRKLWVSSWIMLVLTLGLVGGCGATTEPSQTAPTLVVSPTLSATPTQLPTVTPVPAATSTQTPTPTPQPSAGVVLVILDCTLSFCIPAELELQVERVNGKPGIINVAFVGEYHVRLDYDPTQLTQEEAIQVFESTTSFETEVTE